MDDIDRLIERSADLYAAWHRQQFALWMESAICAPEIESPIERLFWIAFNAMAAQTYCDVNLGEPPDEPAEAGLWVVPQAVIGRYRADFLVTCCPAKRVPFTCAVVELDGHAFHDRDQKQRSNEKRRDRELQRLGYRVLHFTGSDVVADPFRCAHEVLRHLDTLISEAYDAADPLGTGTA